MSFRLWGRKVKVQVTCIPDDMIPKGDSGSLASKLPVPDSLGAIVFEQSGANSKDTVRITFDVNYPGISAYYLSEIVLYNVSDSYVEQIQKSGTIVELFAGYEEANYGCIFKGWIYQTLWERENVINYKLTLRCVDGDKLYTVNNLIQATVNPGMRFNDRMNHLLGKASRTVPKKEDFPEVTEYQALERQETFFKSVDALIKDSYGMKNANTPANYSSFGSQGNVHVIDKNNPQYEKEAIVVSPTKGGLIGTPQQTQYGCSFITLLNANIMLKYPMCTVRLEDVSVQTLKREWGDLKSSSLVNMNHVNPEILLYMVTGVRHVGDTRGSTWYSYVTGCNLTGEIPTNLNVTRGIG